MRMVFSSSLVCSRSGRHDVFADAHRGEQRAALERHADLPAHGEHLAFVRVADVDAEQPHRSAARLMQTEQMAQKCTFTRSRSAHDHADLARVHAEIHAVQDAPAAVPGLQFVHVDQRGGGRVHRLRKNEKIMSATMM